MRVPIFVHRAETSAQEVLVDRDAVPWDLALHNLISIEAAEGAAALGAEGRPSSAQKLRPDALVLRVASLEKPRGGVVLSVLKRVAEACGLRTRQPVLLGSVERPAAWLDVVELSFRDQFATLPDMWRLRDMTRGACLHVGSELHTLQVRHISGMILMMMIFHSVR